MVFWKIGGFFGNIVKWWQQVVLPKVRINNNRSNRDERIQISTIEDGVAESSIEQDDNLYDEVAPQKEEPDTPDDIARKKAEELQKEAEKRRQAEIAKVQQEMQEKERIASIMNANKVNVAAFIEAGKDAAEELKKEEEMRRAQEIIDRLNSEAAEDAAKKQAEINDAKKMAEEKFG